MTYIESASSSKEALEQARAKDPEASLRVERVGEGKYLITPKYGQAGQIHTRTETTRPLGAKKLTKVVYQSGGRTVIGTGEVTEFSEQQKAEMQPQTPQQIQERSQAPQGYREETFTTEEAVRLGLISRYTSEEQPKTVTLYVQEKTSKADFIDYAEYLKGQHLDIERDRIQAGKGRFHLTNGYRLKKQKQGKRSSSVKTR